MTRLLLAAISLAVMLQAPPSAALVPYTRLESVLIDNLRWEGKAAQRAVDDWRMHVAAVKAELEAARPGWVWNADTGEWTVKPKEKT